MDVIDRRLMNSFELQPLQQLAFARVAISVCESEDVQYMIGSFSKIIGSATEGFSDDQWEQLCSKVRNKLEQISAHKSIIDIVLEKMWPICFEIFKWIFCHDADMGIDYSPKFCWTSLISINYEETAKLLTENETLDIKKRFKLACVYCLELEVRSLWEIMSLSEKRSFFVRGNLKKSDLNPIVIYWTYYIQEVPLDYWESKTLNPTELFDYAVEKGYLGATKLFLGKLKVHLRNRMISYGLNYYHSKLYKHHSLVKCSHFAIASFLKSELSPRYRGRTSFSAQGLILRYFLEWPLQKHFIVTFNLLKSHFTDGIYGKLLEIIFEKDLWGFKDYDYKKLFMEFWLQSPGRYTTYVNTQSRVGFKMLFRFIKRHFEFIFDEHSFDLKEQFRATVLQRESSEDVSDFGNENVDFFKFLVRERVTTKESINRFAYEIFMGFPFERYGISFYKLSLRELMYLIDGILGIV